MWYLKWTILVVYRTAWPNHFGMITTSVNLHQHHYVISARILIRYPGAVSIGCTLVSCTVRGRNRSRAKVFNRGYQKHILLISENHPLYSPSCIFQGHEMSRFQLSSKHHGKLHCPIPFISRPHQHQSQHHRISPCSQLYAQALDVTA